MVADGYVMTISPVITQCRGVGIPRTMRSVFPHVPRNEGARVARQWFRLAATVSQAVTIYGRWRRVMLRQGLRERIVNFREALYTLRWIGAEQMALPGAGIRRRTCQLGSPSRLDRYDSRYDGDSRDDEIWPDGLSQSS